MERFLKNAWAAITNSDTTEGRGSDVIIGYFKDKRDAINAAKGKGVMGSDAKVEDRTIDIKIFSSYNEFIDSLNDNIKQRALSKLTVEEKRVLGF